MIERMESVWRRIRSWFHASEWGIRLLGLSKSSGTETEPGLVLVQIDGLSRRQLETALGKGKMPFLKQLLGTEGYRMHTLYSGLPASTPAVQGELLYGVPGCVPAFSFQDRSTGEVVKMFDPEPVAKIQESLEKNRPHLLENGSTYANIFSGGAAETHFCPATFGWDHITRAIHPINLLGFFFSHALSLLRTGFLLLVESVLAVGDCIRGLIGGKDLLKELKFVPTRVAISILLRDLVTLGARMDVLRGLPVVHINFLGYDEQAHRRGPTSDFAHWTLKGIDAAIRRVVHTARMSSRRDYEVWVFSDHGQEETVPFPRESGKSVQEAVAKVFTQFGPPLLGKKDTRGIQFERSKWLGTAFLNWLVGENDDQDAIDRSRLVVTALGSLGHLYTPVLLDQPEKARLAKKLVEEAHIPTVLYAASNGDAHACTRDGLLHLPQDAEKLLGPEHPFLEEAAQDLVKLSHHPNAGDLILSGWRLGRQPVSFPMENGSHTGPGPEETRAFALLPVTTPLETTGDYLRPLQLREAALRYLKRHPSPQKPQLSRRKRRENHLRIMTYNIHYCINMDGKTSPKRIAKVIAHYDPDIVCLQELDVRRMRTGSVDQVHFIAHELDMDFHFAPAVKIQEEEFGNAVLTRFPMQLVHAGRLPGIPDRSDIEPRGALWVEIGVDGKTIQLFNTHFGLREQERIQQVNALMGKEWLGHPDCRDPVILCGDFNALPRSRVCNKLRRKFIDAQWSLNDHRPQRTFFGRFPVGRIDHIFVSPGIEVRGIEVPRTALTRTASDHLPLIAEVKLPD